MSSECCAGLYRMQAQTVATLAPENDQVVDWPALAGHGLPLAFPWPSLLERRGIDSNNGLG